MIEILHNGNVIAIIDAVERMERTPVYSDDGSKLLYTRFMVMGRDAGVELMIKDVPEVAK